MTAHDLADGRFFIGASIVTGVLLGGAWLYRVLISFDLKRHMRREYGCTCGGEFRLVEQLSAAQADLLIGKIDAGRAPPQTLSYTCSRCGQERQRVVAAHQSGVVWR